MRSQIVGSQFPPKEVTDATGVRHRDCEYRRTDSTYWVFVYSAPDVVLSMAPVSKALPYNSVRTCIIHRYRWTVLSRLALCGRS